MRVVILQPPAWPWEIPGDSLARALAVPRISFGDLLRAHLRQGTELGIRSAGSMNSGRPLPDEITTAIVRRHLRQTAPAAFLLDRYPLNAAQALALDELLHELGSPLDRVLRLHLPEQEVERHVRRQAAPAPIGNRLRTRARAQTRGMPGESCMGMRDRGSRDGVVRAGA